MYLKLKEHNVEYSEIELRDTIFRNRGKRQL